MKLPVIAAVLGLAAPAFSYTKTYSLSYDSMYDHKDKSLHDVVCSTGEHGLLTHGYKTFHNIPTYPYVGGAPQIHSWNSPYCGSCWELKYVDKHGDSKVVNYTAIDAGGHHSDGFTISLKGLDFLTDGKGEEFEHRDIPISVMRKPPSWCGL